MFSNRERSWRPFFSGPTNTKAFALAQGRRLARSVVPPCFSDRTSITLHSQPFSGVRRSPLLSASRTRLGGEFGTKRAGLHRVHLDRQLSEFRFGCLLLLLYATSLSVVRPVAPSEFVCRTP